MQTTPEGRIVRPEDTKPAEVQGRSLAVSVQTAQQWIMKLAPEIERALPKHLTAERLLRVCLTALRTTPQLAECTQPSLLACILSAAQMGLEVNTPLQYAWLIPRQRNRRDRQGQIVATSTECTLMLGYQGMLELVHRTERATVWARAVREGDFFEYEDGLEPRLRWRPSGEPNRERKPLTHVFAVCRFRNGFALPRVLTAAEVESRRARSDSGRGKFSPWQTDPEAMYAKTGVRALWPWVPKSVEMGAAAAIDEAPELGKSVLEAVDVEVLDALQRQGLDVTAPERDDEPEGPVPPAAANGLGL